MNLPLAESPNIMGVLNLTPDSFSDGGKYCDPESAAKHSLFMIHNGADIIDIGGESTRPGSKRVSAEEQKSRVMDIIKEIRNQAGDEFLISIDTTQSTVAELAIKAGANIINDTSAGRDDPGLVEFAADKNCPYIIMHMQGSPENMQDNPRYENVVEDVRAFLMERIDHLQAAGVKLENIIIDPGIGFGKTSEHNFLLLKNLHRFVDTGYPVLLGTSRKRFMKSLCDIELPDQLTGATCATTVLGVSAGVRIFRVHDVRENRQSADITWALMNNKF